MTWTPSWLSSLGRLRPTNCTGCAICRYSGHPTALLGIEILHPQDAYPGAYAFSVSAQLPVSITLFNPLPQEAVEEVVA